MSIVTLILLLSMPAWAFAIDKADLVLVIKSESKLLLVKDDQVFRAYRVAFGANPRGHKQQEGDERTPEGRYLLDYKKEKSDFYKAIHISYPNEEDRRRAEAAGVDPGGAIMIHGQKNGSDRLLWIMQNLNWTDGCIAVSNSAMDEIWEAVSIGTPIEIRP
jgi:murein L,D-transpeptidase YafK